MISNFLIDQSVQRIDLWTTAKTCTDIHNDSSEIALPNVEVHGAWTVTIPIAYFPNHRIATDETQVGRLQIVILSNDRGNTLAERVHSAIQRAHRTLQQLEWNRHPVFVAMVPFCTRRIGCCLASTFMPNTLRAWNSESSFRPLFIIVAIIADLATVAFRLISFIPRAIYQRCTRFELPFGMDFVDFQLRGAKIEGRVADLQQGYLLVASTQSITIGEDKTYVQRAYPNDPEYLF